jgi:hypothetical protein
MKVVEFSNDNNEIYDMSYVLVKERFIIRWKWPKDINLVYILKTNYIDDFSLDNINDSNVKLYTKDEYKEFGGYCENIKEINQYKYYIFPVLESEEDIILLKQDNGKNEIIVNTGKPEISYEIKEVKSIRSFFSKEKILQIIINSEAALKKDVLCYVKNQGSPPVNKNDGICFDFVDNISCGMSIMPEITVSKNEYVKVFIKDIDKYGNAYQLIQE